MHTRTSSWLLATPWLLATAGVAQARVDPAMERQVGGVLSNACGNPAQPMVRLYGDVMSVEQGGRKVAATRFRTLRSSPVMPAPAGFKVAFEGEVPGGDGLVFVLTHDKEGLFVTLVGGPKSLAQVGPGLVGQRLRHCDPNRNALPGAPPPESAQGPGTLLADPAFKAAWLRALGPLAREPWIARMNGPAPPNRKVRIAGLDYTQAAVCKPHDCGDHNLVLLYAPAQGALYVQLHQGGRDATLGAPPPAVAAELPGLWKAQWRR